MSRARARLPILHGRRRAIRLLAAVSLGLIVSATAGGPAGGAEEPFIRGSGDSEARIINVGPKAAKLSLAPTLGVALADYLNTLGRGESFVFDWVALEDSIPKEFRDQVPPLRAESTGSAECRDRTRTYPEGSPIGVMEQRAAATPKGPYGESTFFISAFALPGAFEFSGAKARSTAGILEGDIREAAGVTEIGMLSIAGGAVVLKGLRWEAVHRSGSEDEVAGSFTVEAANVGGVPIPIGSGDLRDVVGPINEALEPLGIALRLPRVDTTGGIARISPLSISIFESQLRSTLLGPLFGGIHPVRQPVVDELLGLADQVDEQTGLGAEEEVEEGDREVSAARCSGDPLPQSGSSSDARDYTATSVLVTDITLGVLSGTGSLTVALGGAQAFTEGVAFESPFGTGGFRAPLPPIEQVIPGSPGIPPIPGSPGTDPQAGSIITTTRGGRTVPGDKGGLAIWIGIAGLALAAVIGATDWYLIRRGRSVLPTGPTET